MTDHLTSRRRFIGAALLAAGGPVVIGQTLKTPGAQAATSTNIVNILLETSVREQRLQLYIDYHLAEPMPGAQFGVQVSELDGDTDGLPGIQVPLEDTEPRSDRARQIVAMRWTRPHLWEIGAAYLYKVSVQMTNADEEAVAIYEPIRFGFREVWTQGKELVLNGHPIKLRQAPFVSGLPSMFFYTGMGANAIEFQPNPGRWGNDCATGVRWSGNEALFDAADERGWAVLMPTHSVNQIRGQLDAGDEETIEQYRQDFRACSMVPDRENRPCIIGWLPSMNVGVDINPESLGTRMPADQVPPWATEAEQVIKSEDPTRLVAHHSGGINGADGAFGDMNLPNFYLNLLPLQEREDYLSEWSKNGNMPWGSVEHGPPMTGDFFKGRLADGKDAIPYFTEFFSVYLGDKAYHAEKDAYIEAIADVASDATAVNQPTGDVFQAKGYVERIGEWTAYYDYMDLFIRNTNKAYRTWGVNCGLHAWIQDVGFGIPPDHKHNEHPEGGGLRFTDFDYRELKGGEELAHRPEWANRIYDAYRDTDQPLLVFIGGSEEQFTAKDHNYTSGETAHKTIVAVWDGPGPRQVSAKWELLQNGRVVASGKERFDLEPGTVEKRPISFTVPQVRRRTAGKLRLRVR